MSMKMQAETPVTCNASSVDACVSGDENASNVPLTFKYVSSNYNLPHKAESAGKMSDVRTPKRRINIVKTDAAEQDERSKDQECCTDHALPRRRDRISRACGRNAVARGRGGGGCGGG